MLNSEGGSNWSFNCISTYTALFVYGSQNAISPYVVHKFFRQKCLKFSNYKNSFRPKYRDWKVLAQELHFSSSEMVWYKNTKICCIHVMVYLLWLLFSDCDLGLVYTAGLGGGREIDLNYATSAT